jgi:hypothetical protein
MIRKRRVLISLIEHDHAVTDVLVQPVAGQRGVAGLRCDNRGDPQLFEPGEQPAQLPPQDQFVGQAGQEGAEAVEGNTLGSDRLDCGLEVDKKAIQIELPRCHDLTG